MPCTITSTTILVFGICLSSKKKLIRCVLQPKVVTDVEDEELKRQMEELQLANQEVAGDDDASDQEVGDVDNES